VYYFVVLQEHSFLPQHGRVRRGKERRVIMKKEKKKRGSPKSLCALRKANLTCPKVVSVKWERERESPPSVNKSVEQGLNLSIS
jgi:hypothetical protein